MGARCGTPCGGPQKDLHDAGKGRLPRVHFHDLRHYFAPLAVQKLPLPTAQGYMGHAHISTTMRYVHHSPATEDAAKLAEALTGDRPAVAERVPPG